MNLVDKAAEIAMRAHFGQKNSYNDEPYILHPHRVMIAVRDSGYSFPFPKEEYLATAWLHDAIEDSEETYQSIAAQLDNKNVAWAVSILSKTKGQNLEDYYTKISDNVIAKFVKYCDIQDNFSRNHLIKDDATRLRMAAKYSLGLDILK